jgi:hypothetical protein
MKQKKSQPNALKLPRQQNFFSLAATMPCRACHPGAPGAINQRQTSATEARQKRDKLIL